MLVETKKKSITCGTGVDTTFKPLEKTNSAPSISSKIIKSITELKRIQAKIKKKNTGS
jgi:hypothetical protein